MRQRPCRILEQFQAIAWVLAADRKGQRTFGSMPPIHPGETLREDFLKPLGLTANRVAIELRVPVTRVNDIVRGKRAITAGTALRLARYFGTTP